MEPNSTNFGPGSVQFDPESTEQHFAPLARTNARRTPATLHLAAQRPPGARCNIFLTTRSATTAKGAFRTFRARRGTGFLPEFQSVRILAGLGQISAKGPCPCVRNAQKSPLAVMFGICSAVWQLASSGLCCVAGCHLALCVFRTFVHPPRSARVCSSCFVYFPET